MLKRTALAVTFAAALLAAAPLAPSAADNGTGHPAWGYFMGSDAMFMGIVTNFACTLIPFGLGIGGFGAVVFGLACGLSGSA